jgi:alkylation response protein AidB-like acyl-CoA dehydrogenase
MLKKANFFSDNHDLRWHFENSFDFAEAWRLLSPAAREASGAADCDEYKAMWKDVLDTLGEVSGTVIAPNARKVEEDGVHLDADGRVVVPDTLKQNIETMVQLGAAGVGTSVEFGGTAAPVFIELACMEILYRACPSTALNCSWWGPIAHVIERFGDSAMKENIVPKLASGEWSGAMALTEPDAGSDLAHISTWAEKQADGSWRLSGTKRFITNGNSEVILVLAKNAKGAVGLEHLSLFLCLREDEGRRNIEVTKIEHKLGLKASPTCELKFDGSKAVLMGEDGKGFQAMLKLMNEMRIGVAMQGVGLMEATLRLAREYASQRKAWGKSIQYHELIAEKLLDMEVELMAARSLCLRAANEQGIVRLTEDYLTANPRLPDHEFAALRCKLDLRRRRVRKWTPLIKYWVAENAFLHARQCMQIFGGYGFTTEYRAEWWLRESLILPVYEGTSQIQALMCLKDTMKDAIKKPRVWFEKALGNQWLALSGRNPSSRRLAKCRQLYYSAVLATIRKVVAEAYRSGARETTRRAGDDLPVKARPMDLLRSIRSLGKELRKQENFRPALINAERICEMKAIVEMADCLRRDAKKDPTRTWAFDRFMIRYLPRMVALKAMVDVDDPVLATRLSAGDQESRREAVAAGVAF